MANFEMRIPFKYGIRYALLMSEQVCLQKTQSVSAQSGFI